MVTPIKIDTMGKLFASPDLYPLQIDFQKRSVNFVNMSRDTYANSVFLDLRTKHLGSAFELRLDDLLLMSQSIDLSSRPLHLIFHTSFCCSTLLARQFEAAPSCFVLKEPRLLAQIAINQTLSSGERLELLEMALVLLTRSYSDTNLVVLKPNDWFNPMALDVLSLHPKATITFMHVPLKAYLLAILKSEERREWARKRAEQAAIDLSGRLHMNVSIAKMRDAEIIAYLWLAHRTYYRIMANGPHRLRCLGLDGEQFALASDDHLQELISKLQLPLTKRDLNVVRREGTMSQYSKDLSRPFDTDSHLKEMHTLEQCWRAELEQGLTWAASHNALCWEGPEARMSVASD